MGTDFVRAPSKASLLALLKSAKKLDARLLSRLFDGVMFKSEYKDSITEDVETVVDDNPVSRHSSLSGLLSDDHTQYARTDGTRAITGQQTFEAGILTDTIGEETAAAGVTIDTLLIKDGNIAAIDYAFVTANDGATSVTAAELEELTDASTTTLHDHDSTYYTETEIDTQMDAIDYAFVSANDSDTNVTAAQLEELSDGSETLLHSHVHSHDTESFPPICFASYIDVKARNAVYSLHGGFNSLDTAHDLGAGDLVVTCGTGKIMLAIIAANDFAGDITVTGTTVDRNTGAETGADTDTITIDALTTDNSSTDASSNVVHAFTGAYVTSKWFKGSITISSADTDVTDMDTYQVSFEQINDSADITLKTFDITADATNSSAWLYAYLYTFHVTGDKCDVDTESSIDLPAAEVTSGNTYRLRRGEINESFSGVTDGFWVEMHPGPFASTYWENINVKVWVEVGTDGETTGDPIPPSVGTFWNWDDDADEDTTPTGIENEYNTDFIVKSGKTDITGSGYDVASLGFTKVAYYVPHGSATVSFDLSIPSTITTGTHKVEFLIGNATASATQNTFEIRLADGNRTIDDDDAVLAQLDYNSGTERVRMFEYTGLQGGFASTTLQDTNSVGTYDAQADFTDWNLVQTEFDLDTGSVKIRCQNLGAQVADTGWITDDGTKFSNEPFTKITIVPRNYSGNDAAVAQVWYCEVGTGTGQCDADYWPNGAKDGIG